MKRIFFYILIGLFCIPGQAFAQTPKELQSNLPTIKGWKISPEVEMFNKDNLYERINGAAPLFFENNFQEMTSMVYTKGEDYITIQAYRHATPEDAFGMYASERSSDMNHYEEIGGEAQGDEYGLFFFSDCIYVKMSANNEGEEITEAMKEIAKGLAEKIDPEADYPVLFELFPEEGAIPYTESYISTNYIGHEFLKSAYTLNYILDEKEIQAFVIDAETYESAKQILREYFKFTKQAEEELIEGDLLIKDRYNGDIPVFWQGRYIMGVFSENGEELPESVYELLHLFS